MQRHPASLKAPVTILCFNRPEQTARVFERIAASRPETLLVVRDGPRPDRSGEAELCEAVGKIVCNPTWKCEVLTNISPINLGCRNRVSSGLDWVFSNVESSIVLEDDCLPDPTFFGFCAELLERYRDDERVMSVGGFNCLGPEYRIPGGYYFSRYADIWGWATWKRAWKHYDVNMRKWPEARDQGLLSRIFSNPRDASYWTKILQVVYEGRIDTWDYQWQFACWLAGGLGILPGENLVTNIGYGAGATHTTHDNEVPRWVKQPLGTMPRELFHPPGVIRDRVRDECLQRIQFSDPSLPRKVLNRLKTLISGS